MRPFLGLPAAICKGEVCTMPRKRGNGDGTIYKMESKGLWAAQLTIGVDANGKPKRKTIYGKRQADVRAKLDALKNELATGSIITPDKMTVGDMARCLTEEDRALNIIGENSYLRKNAICVRISRSALGSIPLQKVKPADIQSYLMSITEYSNSVIAKDYGMLTRCFRTALYRNILNKDPMVGLRKPKSVNDTRRVRALTVDEEKKLIAVLNDQERSCPYRAQFLLMLYTGMRMGEINALDIHDVNLAFRTVNIRRTVTRDSSEHSVLGKTTKTYAGQRLLSLPDMPFQLLSDHLKNWRPNKMDLLFFDYRANKIITTNQANMTLKRLISKYALLDQTVPGTVTLHSLRHTYATRCIESGMHAKSLQKRLGHTDIKTTLDTYCDVFEKFDKEASDRADAYMQDLLFA